MWYCVYLPSGTVTQTGSCHHCHGGQQEEECGLHLHGEAGHAVAYSQTQHPDGEEEECEKRGMEVLVVEGGEVADTGAVSHEVEGSSIFLWWYLENNITDT